MRSVFLYLMSALYIAAGINHFWHEEYYLLIMPPWLPWHHALVVISGICEILFGILLLFVPTRRFAAWCIILLLIAVFPANIQMLINYKQTDDPKLWLAVVRLPIQILLIWWAYSFTKNKSGLKNTVN
ncbi:MAG: MauE/DoxX family redox-associated membrane protein [Chitinophagaceae bacterium]